MEIDMMHGYQLAARKSTYSMGITRSMDTNTQYGLGLAAWTWKCSFDKDTDMTRRG
jgi:hypothetical protein